jgi:hypothetical protein
MWYGERTQAGALRGSGGCSGGLGSHAVRRGTGTGVRGSSSSAAEEKSGNALKRSGGMLWRSMGRMTDAHSCKKGSLVCRVSTARSVLSAASLAASARRPEGPRASVNKGERRILVAWEARKVGEKGSGLDEGGGGRNGTGGDVSRR